MKTMTKYNLEYIATNLAKFAYSTKQPIHGGIGVRATQPYFYRWRKDQGLDIFTYTNSTDTETAKFYRYSPYDVARKINIDLDIPSAKGTDALTILREIGKSK